MFSFQCLYFKDNISSSFPTKIEFILGHVALGTTLYITIPCTVL